MNVIPDNTAELDHFIAEPDDATIEAIRNSEGSFAVLGAGGKMGFHLCLMLQKILKQLGREEPVRAVSRFTTVRARDEFESIGCEVIPADLSDPEQLKSLPDTPNIFYLAGVKFGTSSDSALLHKMNVKMPRLVAHRYQTSKIVALSTGCVYSFVSPESGGSTESDQTAPPGDYARSCLGREQAFIDAAENYGTQSALIRLNYSIDLRYGVLLDIAGKVKSGQPVEVSNGYVNLIWQGDAIRHTLQSLGHVASPPFIINVTGAEVLSVRDLAIQIAARFGVEAVITGEEAPTAWLNNATKSHQLYGEPSVSVEQMIDWVVDWVRTGGELYDKPTHFQTRDGNY